MNHAKSVGLAVVGGYLRQKFVVRHSCRRRQIEFFSDAALYVFGYVDSQLNALLVFCHIKKCLVDRQWLYDVCIIMENRVDMLGNLFIHTHPYRCEYQLRTAAKSNDRRHRAVDSITTGFIAGGRNHSATPFVAYGNGLAAQLRIVALLDCRKKCVHVDMYYFPQFLIFHTAKLHKKRKRPSPRRRFQTTFSLLLYQTSLLETCDAVDLTTYYIFNLYLINSQTKKQT